MCPSCGLWRGHGLSGPTSHSTPDWSEDIRQPGRPWGGGRSSPCLSRGATCPWSLAAGICGGVLKGSSAGMACLRLTGTSPPGWAGPDSGANTGGQPLRGRAPPGDGHPWLSGSAPAAWPDPRPETSRRAVQRLSVRVSVRGVRDALDGSPDGSSGCSAPPRSASPPVPGPGGRVSSSTPAPLPRGSGRRGELGGASPPSCGPLAPAGGPAPSSSWSSGRLSVGLHCGGQSPPFPPAFSSSVSGP
jgi:hypothetical protein